MSDDLLKKLGLGDKPKKKRAKKHSGPAPSRPSKATATRDPLGLEKSLTDETRLRRRAAERGGGKSPPMPKPKTATPKAPSSLGTLVAKEKRITARPGILKRIGSKIAQASGAVERSALRQAAGSGARAGLGRAVAGSALTKGVGVAGDVLAIGAAAYTGLRAYQAHRELGRKKSYAEKHYGTIAKAQETRRRKAAQGK